MNFTARLAFLVETVQLEARSLLETDRRLFAAPFDADRAKALRTQIDVRDAAELAQALNQGHALVPLLLSLATAIAADCRRRGVLGA